MEQWNRLTAAQQAEVLRRLQQSGANQATVQTGEVQLPPVVAPGEAPQPTPPPAAPTEEPFQETPYDFGVGPGGPDDLENLQLFGREIFELTPETWEPVTSASPGPDYQVGPGDQVIISMWGEVQEVYDRTVNREGYILLPDVGQVVLLGLTVAEAKRHLLQVMTPYHHLLAYGREDARAFLDVTLGKLRSIKIFVLGNAVRPGAYNLTGMATAFTSLYYAGGPSNQGSMRVVRVIRGDTIIAEIDLYDYVLRGDKSNDVQLWDGDIVFVPDIGSKIALRGRVHRPAIYELKGSESLGDLLEISGGLTAAAYREKAQIVRIVPPEMRDRYPDDRVTMDVVLLPVLEGEKEVPLFDGDVFTAFSILDLRRDFVVIGGAVWRPAQYQITEGMRLTDALEAAEGLKEEAYLERVDIIRTNPDYTTTQIRVNLAQALEGDAEENILLAQLDRIMVHSIHDIEPRKYVEIEGHVRRPGQYLLHEDMRLSDLLFRAGGLQDPDWLRETYLESADLIRTLPDSIGRIQESFNLGRVLAGDSREDRLLKSEDIVRVYSMYHFFEPTRFVTIEGHVRSPGRYPLFEDMRLSDLINQAGGLEDPEWAKETYLDRGDLVRVAPDSITRTIEWFDVRQVLAGNLQADRLLRADDLVRIYSIFTIVNRKYARVAGEVQNPGEYEIEENTTANDLIIRAGGLTPDAWPVGAEISRVDPGATGEDKRVTLLASPIDTTFTGRNQGVILQNYDLVVVRRQPYWELQRNVIVTGEVAFPSTFSLETPGERLASIIRRAGGLTPYAYSRGARLIRRVEGAGLVGIDLAKAMANPDSRENLVMMPGDSLHVPEFIPTVRVVGSVGYPTSILHSTGRSTVYYINEAGGLLKNADKSRIYVVQANGAVSQARLFGLLTPQVEPGATIFVPPKDTTGRDVWEVIRDTTALISNLTMVLLLIWQISR